MSIGERLKKFRKDHLLTLRKASQIFGVSPAEITRIESQKNQPHFITIDKWEKMLDKAEREEC
jgi:transcriptional regulator with XRE-family HTH domain